MNYEERQRILGEVRQAVQEGRIAEAIAIVANPYDYSVGESFSAGVLDIPEAPIELIDAALEGFVKTRRNWYQQHGYWVHSLSHFTSHLWERRLVDWIRRLNEISFKGAIELGDSNCSDRLVGDFARYALWSDDPKDFGLTRESISWMKWSDWNRAAKLRIEAGRFESEAAWLHWKLEHAEVFLCHDPATSVPLVLTRLQELGEDVVQYANLLRELLEAELRGHRENLASPHEWVAKEAARAIERIEAKLAEL